MTTTTYPPPATIPTKAAQWARLVIGIWVAIGVALLIGGVILAAANGVDQLTGSHAPAPSAPSGGGGLYMP